MKINLLQAPWMLGASVGLAWDVLGAPLSTTPMDPVEGDPCYLNTSPGIFVGYENARSCLDSFPFNESHRAPVLDVLKKTFDLYVFRDISIDYQDGAIVSKVDTRKELAELKSKPYQTEREFQEDIYDLFMKFNDAHTRFTSTCYHTWTFYQPWILTQQITSDGKQRVYIQEPIFVVEDNALVSNITSSLFAEWARLGINPFSYNGFEVVSINDRDPVEAIVEYADKEIAATRDAAIRFNLAFGRFDYIQGRWRAFNGMFPVRSRLPTEATVRYGLAGNGTTFSIEVPFVARPPQKTNSTAHYRKAYCDAWNGQNLNLPILTAAAERRRLLGTPANEGLNGAPDSLTEDLLEELEHYEEEVQEVPFIPGRDFETKPAEREFFDPDSRVKAPLVDIYQPLQNGSIDASFLMRDDEDPDFIPTGVLKISSFDEGTVPNGPGAFKRWMSSVSQLRDQGAKKLIIDVSNNGGGLICLGYAFARYLFPNTPVHDADFISSEFFEALVASVAKTNRSSLFHYNKNWVLPGTRDRPQDATWMLEGPIYTRGGVR
ncbi:hypothetical protein HK102_001392 [Quaeritorhiza haematococci]|nr:hypothetical protein HK102_001392 [Quaeritorhiza haematococci]